MRGGTRLLSALIIGWMACGPFLAVAETGDIKQEVDALNTEVDQKQTRVDELDANIKKYKAKIAENEKAVASLQNSLALLENRIEEKQLAIQKTRTQMDIASIRMEDLQGKIKVDEETVARRQDALAAYVRQINESDGVSMMDIFLTRPSLSDFFSRVEQVKKIEQDLTRATKEVKASKAALETERVQVEQQRSDLEVRKKELETEQAELERDRSAKSSLVSATKGKESEYQRIVYELRQEQQSISSEIVDLRDTLKDKLNSADEALARGDVLLDWPVPVQRGISAHFHDRSYPFRNLFEHPGTDVPTPVGTPIRAAAGGYVAWTKVGKQYGNYIMIVHPGNIATVYAHLSRFAVSGDTYVDRGDIIGYSGGQPGMPGAGLSTGPHLHFEVRLNGIPVNAENYLPGAD
ncbi:MAG: peptidoglycan DD-metalloendopeptidase family protein [bacterium]|nr:peptidoglycan DD-metalloendopeptidase family protein [bacterium]